MTTATPTSPPPSSDLRPGVWEGATSVHPHPLPGASASCSRFSWGLGVGAGGQWGTWGDHSGAPLDAGRPRRTHHHPSCCLLAWAP